MRALIKMSDRKLAVLVEESLNGLGFSFIRNQGRNVTEFEVRAPCHFVVSVENLARERVGYPFRSGVSVESAIEVKRLIGSPDPEEALREHSSAFVRELKRKLPGEPWRGLGVFRSREEKRIWEALGLK